MKMSWQQIPSPIITEILCKYADGVVLDTEHGCFNNESISACIQVATLAKKHCFIRLTEISNTLIRHCLDSGATGLIFSTVETEEQARLIKKLSYYLIGPYDLSLSLNVPGKFDNEQFLCYINKVKEKVPESKLAVHIPNDVKNQIHKYKGYGLKCLGMDTMALLDYHKEIIKNA